MPYALQKAKGGYYVITEGTGKKHSLKPLPKMTAEAQMKALYYAMMGAKKK
jgi:hypothetical protein